MTIMATQSVNIRWTHSWS